MRDAVTVAVDIPMVGDERLKSWAKVVDSVDESKSSGWAFVGGFVAAGGIQDVPIGSVLLVYGERGSRADPRPQAALFTVNADATLTPRAEAKGRAWARTLRDEVADLVSDELRSAAGRLDLASIPDDDLLDEVRRRGLIGPG